MKVALVTGASRGIGRACALRLAEDGYVVAVNYKRGREQAEAALAEIERKGGEGMLCPADVSDPEQVKEMFHQIGRAYRQLNVLVNNAGIVRDEYLLAMKPETLDACLNLNVKGYFYCAQQAALKMYTKGSGKIINISSVSGQTALCGQSVYSATKGSVDSMTRVLAKELAGRGIQVNAVAPGFITTEMLDALPEDKKDEYLRAIPQKRFGTTEEVAELVAFLASDRCPYLTGQVITLDGGLSL